MTSAFQTEQNRVLEPLTCLSKDTGTRILLIILNMPLNEDWEMIKHLWSKAELVACADGGANRLHDCLAREESLFLPHIITGDLDSIRPQVQEFFQSKGVEVIRTFDQDYTDFTKCLKVCLEKTKGTQLDVIVVTGCFGGRLDQVLANINTLYEGLALTSTPILLLHDSSLACLLTPGHHVLKVNTGWEGDWCGLVPVGVPCKSVHTTGLKWNLSNNSMKFGELISTSNTFDGSGEVTVTTDQPLLWTMGVKYQ